MVGGWVEDEPSVFVTDRCPRLNITHPKSANTPISTMAPAIAIPAIAPLERPFLCEPPELLGCDEVVEAPVVVVVRAAEEDVVEVGVLGTSPIVHTSEYMVVDESVS